MDDSRQGRLIMSCGHDETDQTPVARDYFGKDVVCVGVAQSMNVSSGYPIGIIYYRLPAPTGKE